MPSSACKKKLTAAPYPSSVSARPALPIHWRFAFSAARASASGSILFFFNDTATTEIYTLSLHDALPISMNTAAIPGGITSEPDDLAPLGGAWCTGVAGHALVLAGRPPSPSPPQRLLVLRNAREFCEGRSVRRSNRRFGEMRRSMLHAKQTLVV